MIARLAFGSALVLVLGCGGDDDDDGVADDGDDTTTMASATDPGTADSSPSSAATMTDGSATASESGADDAPAESSGASATTGEGEASTAAAESSGDGGGNSCTPDGADDPCRECVKANCCDDWIACANDEVCACTIDCHLGGASLGSCKNQCGGDPETYEALYFCGQMFCLGTCDWDCC